MKKERKSIVATGHEAVSWAAEVILREGGNAFDAAVSGGFAGAIAEQTLTSLGGGGFLLAREKNGKATFFDFFVDTPGLGLKRRADNIHFFPVTIEFGGSKQDFNIGAGSVAVPGTLKGLLHVHERLGRLPLNVVLEPAIQLARGHELNEFQATFLAMLRPIMTMSERGRRLYAPEGRYLARGDTLKMPELADFLASLPEERDKNFYQGDIAEKTAREIQEQGGLLTLDDLSAYRVIERKPLDAHYRGYTLLTSPPPSFGGPLIALSLDILDKMPPPEKWGSPEHLLRILKLMQEIDSMRASGILDGEQIQAFKDGMGADNMADKIRMFSRGTTHISISDSMGNIASMTCSNGEGSGCFVPGTGIMLNNMMGEDDLHPDGFHASPPGMRVGSMMSPSALLFEDEVRLVLGSGGSKRIRSAMTQVITHFVDFNEALQKIIDSPRIHWDGSVLQVEPGFGETALAALREKAPVNLWEEINVYFGGVHSVIPGITGAGDPRRGGSTVETL
jgi:gamma-glutamyltranspeptidase/glutathione hydrolase